MKVKEDKKEEWQKYADVNNTNPYGECIITFCKTWAGEMEKVLAKGKKLKKVWQELAHKVSDDMGTWGLTMAQFGCACQVLIECWEHGEELKPLYEGWR